MKLIPAIDLMGGAVVQAKGGTRQQYRPLHTDLFPYAEPLKVILTILKHLDADIIYLADLDALSKQGDQHDLISDIVLRFPDIEFWVDTGIGKYAELNARRLPQSAIAVVGTETLREDLTCFADKRYILSLDFNRGQPVGCNVLSQLQHWPPRTIALSLERIGSRRGPDLALLKQLRACYKGELYAGGGVRNRDDLKALSAIGVIGALTANALYRSGGFT